MRAVYKYQIWLDCFWYLLKLKLCCDNVSYLVRYYGRSNRGFQFLSMCKVWYSHMQWQFKGSALFFIKKTIIYKDFLSLHHLLQNYPTQRCPFYYCFHIIKFTKGKPSGKLF